MYKKLIFLSFMLGFCLHGSDDIGELSSIGFKNLSGMTEELYGQIQCALRTNLLLIVKEYFPETFLNSLSTDLRGYKKNKASLKSYEAVEPFYTSFKFVVKKLSPFYSFQQRVPFIKPEPVRAKAGDFNRASFK